MRNSTLLRSVDGADESAEDNGYDNRYGYSADEDDFGGFYEESRSNPAHRIR
jgi:hypothetical protein